VIGYFDSDDATHVLKRFKNHLKVCAKKRGLPLQWPKKRAAQGYDDCDHSGERSLQRQHSGFRMGRMHGSIPISCRSNLRCVSSLLLPASVSARLSCRFMVQAAANHRERPSSRCSGTVHRRHVNSIVRDLRRGSHSRSSQIESCQQLRNGCMGG